VKGFIYKLTMTFATWTTLPLRLAVGIVFIAHGAQKVFGTFGGPALRKWMTLTPLAPSLMRPAWFWLAADALGEFIGGVLILLGLFTRVGAFLIFCAMLTAIIHVHWPNFFLTNKGFEYPMTLLAVTVSLMITGGGRASIDRYIADRKV
jgi:putative oxidoreductase